MNTMQTPLQQLLKIPVFSRSVRQGSHFSFKLRRKYSEALIWQLTALKQEQPELVWHHSKIKDTVIFGGTFHNSSDIYNKLRLLR